MKIDIDVPNRPTNEEQVSHLESITGLCLPKSYKNFLLEQNGGIPVNGVFGYGEGGSSGVVFFGVCLPEKYNDILCNYEIYKDRIPEGLFPIGSDPGGNLICIDLESPAGVYFWEHEKEGRSLSSNGVFKLSGSFDEFIDSLAPDEGAEDW